MTVLPTFHSLASLSLLFQKSLSPENSRDGGSFWEVLLHADLCRHLPARRRCLLSGLPLSLHLQCPHGKFLRQPYRVGLRGSLRLSWKPSGNPDILLGNFRHPRKPGLVVSDLGAFSLSRFLPWTEHRAEVMTSGILTTPVVYCALHLQGECGCEGQGTLFRGFIFK